MTDLPIEPLWDCASLPRDPARSPVTCPAAIECERAADCDAMPFGRCVGESTSFCDYGAERIACGNGATCPKGALCVDAPVAKERCFDDGECEQLGYYCIDFEAASCETDDDCKAMPGGRCRTAIVETYCDYTDACTSDADCPELQRCVCDQVNRCVHENCRVDGDCGAGETCHWARGCAGRIHGFFCTQPSDDCSGDFQCGGRNHCIYDAAEERRVCGSRCPPLP